MARTSQEEIVAIRQEASLELHPLKQYGDATAVLVKRARGHAL
jgi:hypothetical protein